jgi:hypothetical protein
MNPILILISLTPAPAAEIVRIQFRTSLAPMCELVGVFRLMAVAVHGRSARGCGVMCYLRLCVPLSLSAY